MTNGTAQNAIESSHNMLVLRNYKPYRYGGKWFCASFDGQGYAYRAKSDLLKKAAKMGKTSIEFATLA